MVLGETVRAAIYKRLENHYELNRTDIPEQLEAFHKALERMFNANSKAVERLIAKNLYARLGLQFTQHPEWTLIEYVDFAKVNSGSIQVTNSA